MNKLADIPPSAALPPSAPSAASLAMIDRLIGFPTVSRDSNLGLIEYARDELARLGVRANLIYDAARNKANLFATLSAEPDRIKTGGLVISGHTDTVPVDGQDWSSDPFRADHRDARIHGRAVDIHACREQTDDPDEGKGDDADSEDDLHETEARGLVRLLLFHIHGANFRFMMTRILQCLSRVSAGSVSGCAKSGNPSSKST